MAKSKNDRMFQHAVVWRLGVWRLLLLIRANSVPYKLQVKPEGVSSATQSTNSAHEASSSSSRRRRVMLRQLTRRAQATAAAARTATTVAAAAGWQQQQPQQVSVLRGRTVGVRWASSVVVTRDDGLPDLIITPLAAKVSDDALWLAGHLWCWIECWWCAYWCVWFVETGGGGAEAADAAADAARGRRGRRLLGLQVRLRVREERRRCRGGCVSGHRYSDASTLLSKGSLCCCYWNR